MNTLYIDIQRISKLVVYIIELKDQFETQTAI